MKTLDSDHYEKLNVLISHEERNMAKSIAKKKGMTFQGWLGQLIKRELEAQNADRR